MYIETTEKLLDFIEKSPTAFQDIWNKTTMSLQKMDLKCFRKKNTGSWFREENIW